VTEVIGEGHSNIQSETNALNPAEDYSTAFFASVSTLAIILLIVLRSVMLASVSLYTWPGGHDGLCLVGVPYEEYAYDYEHDYVAPFPL